MVWGFHHDAICEHLQAAYDGKIRKLLIALPPRHSKSSLTSVAYPSWVWLTKPQTRFLNASYAMSLSLRDSQRCRQLIDSEWYQQRFGYVFTWLGDQNKLGRYENDKRGYRLSSSVEGAATGEGGDYIIIDDAHNIQESESDLIREQTLSWWDRVMTSRLNDQLTGRMIVIGQRVHEQDLIGHLLESGDWDYLCLPAEYESNKKSHTSIGWSDPRTEEGEPLWPAKFPKDILEYLKRVLITGYYAQYQQTPVRDSGNIFRASYFQAYTEKDNFYVLHHLDGDKTIHKSRCRTVISTDLALSKTAESDYTVILTWAVSPQMDFLLLDIVCERMEAPEAEELVWSKARGVKRLWTVLVEDVAYQKSAIQRLRRGTPTVGKDKQRRGLPITPYKPTVDKVARAQNLVVWMSAGNFYFNEMLHGFAEYKKQMLGFPRSGKDDMVDASTITNVLFELGEPHVTTYDDMLDVSTEEEAALIEIYKENPELGAWLAEEDGVEIFVQ